ncbi:hypothetical protein K435DRAFT_963665 [Dendrothele bispora CBS 962.96]|uniref:Concanavalin A-like lectin/glucanase n=1 Tax=Dendrothele bispora (strain CBS 962.96) TaxID=1314807 RepID=A0A4S8MG15_DENBC|nr:hypothetical protein K435DRAFT_963665 [Dendrothele bispora CBS 962.96]
MFKVVHSLLVAAALLIAFNPSFTLASPAYEKRTDATCPYPYSIRSTLVSRQSSGLSFTGAQWIWTNEIGANGNSPAGSRAFRKTFSPPDGKTPSHLTIAFSVDNSATLFVNGEKIAHEGNWFAAGTYCVPLKPCTNVIAFNATNETNEPSYAALIVSADVTYTDGTTSHIVSDPSWRVSGPNIPAEFAQSSFDDSAWATATFESAYPDTRSGHGPVPIAGSQAVSLTPSRTIWSADAPDGGGSTQPETRVFRRTVELPPGHTNSSAQVLIECDNEYSLYINGRFIGTQGDWHNAGRYTVNNIQGSQVVIAVWARNIDGPGPSFAGLSAALQITSTDPSTCSADCESHTYVVTDDQWKVSSSVPAGFEQPGFDDSNWSNAKLLRVFNGNSITIPSQDSAPGSPLPGAPAGN